MRNAHRHHHATTVFLKWASKLDRRFSILLVTCIYLLLFFFPPLTYSNTTAIFSLSPFKSIFLHLTIPPLEPSYPSSPPDPEAARMKQKKDDIERARVAICLVGGARRFELTGPSIIKNLLKEYPNADLFLHSPLDKDSFKFSLLKDAPRIAAVRIFTPLHINQTKSHTRVLLSHGSPNGIQGLLQYFNLVEGCFGMIKSHESANNFTYGWVVRTRVDSYWSGPLDPSDFIPGVYILPSGSKYLGLNDRLGVGDPNTTAAALSRLSLIPRLDATGYRRLNSESAFKAQLVVTKTPYEARQMPFCVLSDRRYAFPPGRYIEPVASLGSPGPLSGAKCQPCRPACEGACAADMAAHLNKEWSWIEWRNGSLEFCDARRGLEKGWEGHFEQVAGKEAAAAAKEVLSLSFKACIEDLEMVRRKTISWAAPPPVEICGLGLRLLPSNPSKKKKISFFTLKK